MYGTLSGPEIVTDDVSVTRPRSALARERAVRLSCADLPWLSTVKLPWGLEVGLLNISNSGLLVETSSKFTPGSVAEFQLCGTNNTLVVPARFVRSEVAKVDTRGVKYHAAAVFERELHLEAAQGISTPNAVADWLRQISTELDRGGDPGAVLQHIERGLRGLVSARNVEIREAPITSPDGCESVYFTVSKGSNGRNVLQATFEPAHAVSDLDFRLLQAGAALAAVVLQVTERR